MDGCVYVGVVHVLICRGVRLWMCVPGYACLGRLQYFETSRVKQLCLVLTEIAAAEAAMKEEDAQREQHELKLVRTACCCLFYVL